MDPDPKVKLVGPEDAVYEWNDLRTTGLLWLINRVVFHPRGFCLGLYADNDEEPFNIVGWQIKGNGSETFNFKPEDDDRHLLEVEALFAELRKPTKTFETQEELIAHILGLSEPEESDPLEITADDLKAASEQQGFGGTPVANIGELFEDKPTTIDPMGDLSELKDPLTYRRPMTNKDAQDRGEPR